LINLNKFRTVIVWTLLILIPLLGSGCWNRREVQDLNVNTALGFDQVMVNGRPQFLFSVLTLKTTEAGQSSGTGMVQPRVSAAGRVISVQGETIYDAVRNYSLRSSRQLFMGHTMVVVIGEELAREGINQIIDFLSRHRDIRMRVWVVVCEGLAEDALQTQSEFESLTSLEISYIISRSAPRSSKTVRTNLFQVSYALLNPGREIVLPYMEIFTPPEEGSPIREGNASSGSDSGSSENENQPQKQTFMLTGASVFLGDKLIGRLDEETTEGLNFITNNASSGVIPVAFNASERNASFLFRKTKTKVKPVINEDGSLLYEVQVKGTGLMQEERNAVIDISKEDLEKVEELVNREVERRCLMAVAKCQELNSDVLGLGELLHRRKPKVWKEVKADWGEVFPTVKVEVKAEFKIENSGLIDQPIIVQ